MANITAVAVIEDQAELKKEVDGIAVVIKVTDQVTYESANQRIAKLQALKKDIEGRFLEPKRKAKEAHAAVCDLENSFLSPVRKAIDELKNQTVSWYAAEQRRIDAEAQRKQQESESMVDLACEAERQGDTDLAAEATMAAALSDSEVNYAPQQSKGTSMREKWTAKIVAADKIPREYMIPNMDALNAIAKATKGTLPIPGVEFVKEFTNVTRAAK